MPEISFNRSPLVGFSKEVKNGPLYLFDFVSVVEECATLQRKIQD